LLDPEKIENISLSTTWQHRFVVRTDLTSDVALDVTPCLQYSFLVMECQRIADKKVCDRINVTTDSASTKFRDFANGCTTTHKWIKDY